jgi:hypothetical protein
VASQVIEDDVLTLTLLRDPVDRTISALKHFKRLHDRYRELSLEEIYEDEVVFSYFVDNYQTRIFALKAEDKPDAFSSSRSYDATLDALSTDRDPNIVSTADTALIVVDDSRVRTREAKPGRDRRGRIDVGISRLRRRAAATLRLVARRSRYSRPSQRELGNLGSDTGATRPHHRRQRVRRRVLPVCGRTRSAATRRTWRLASR